MACVLVGHIGSQPRVKYKKIVHVITVLGLLTVDADTLNDTARSVVNLPTLTRTRKRKNWSSMDRLVCLNKIAGEVLFEDVFELPCT